MTATTLPTPTAAARRRRDESPADLERRYGAANYHPLPVTLQRGAGVWLFDSAGRRYLDMMSAYSAVSFGHAHPALVRVLTEQAERLAVTSRAFHTDRLGPFLRAVCETTGMAKALPMNTGAEAVETAVKAARKWAYKVKRVPEGRAEIIVAAGNFAGRTTTIIGFSSEAQYRDGFGPFAPGFISVPFGDAAALEAAITPNTAAFLVEPIQGEAGIIVPPAGYLARAREICTRRGILLICDEVQTGLARTGAVLACDHDGIRPDGLVLGKALGGGLLPVSAFCASEEVMAQFTPGDHGSTFGGNPLAMRAAIETLRLIEEEGLMQNAAATGAALKAALELKLAGVEGVREVRGEGLMIGIELDRPCGVLLQRAADAGLLISVTADTVIRIVPPLIITAAEADEVVDKLCPLVKAFLAEQS